MTTPRHRTDRPRAEPPANPYAPYKRDVARLWVTVVTEHRPAAPPLYHVFWQDEHLGAWEQFPRTEGPLKEPLAEDGRATLYRCTLPDGREIITASIGWQVGCHCPNRFTGGECGCGWATECPSAYLASKSTPSSTSARQSVPAGAADGRLREAGQGVLVLEEVAP